MAADIGKPIVWTFPCIINGIDFAGYNKQETFCMSKWVKNTWLKTREHSYITSGNIFWIFLFFSLFFSFYILFKTQLFYFMLKIEITTLYLPNLSLALNLTLYLKYFFKCHLYSNINENTFTKKSVESFLSWYTELFHSTSLYQL